MQLEKIEMTGFKSFADKTTIEFDKGVTAVVGPNGSGKSNLSEAIKWVLGEQSAKSLRGKKMDDVIFAGSESRKAVNFAEVNLYINNEDHVLPIEQSQVVLTRRYNRNGESDFFINKKPCRLKDITSLMMDSGLGKDSFALISQGKVEKIFNDKPEERRSIIEEAAGVLKYKDRKQQAVRKLEQTQAHLNRVEDILHEIRSQLVPLEEQRAKAVHYLSKKEELTHIETALLAVEIETLHAQWKIAVEEVEQFKTEIDRITRYQEEVEIEQEQTRAEQNKVETEFSTLQASYVQLVQKVEQLDGERKVLLQRRDYLLQSDEENQQALQEAIRNQERIIGELEQLERLKVERTVAQQQVEDTWMSLSNQLDKLTNADENKQRQLQESYIEQLQEETRLVNQERHLERSLDVAQAQKERLEGQLDQLEIECVELDQQVEKVTLQGEETARVLLQLQQQQGKQQEQVEQLSHQWTVAQDVVMNLQSQLHRQQAQYKGLKQISEDYAGYYQGVKEVLKHKPTLPGVIGAVAEVVRVPENLTVAIDIALGANSQFIIVENEQSAAAAIAFLKTNRMGRATFLPLNVIRAKEISFDLLQLVQKEEGFIGVASQLVTVEAKYVPIMGHLLGNTIIASTLQSAQRMAKKLHYRIRIVTIDGEVVNAGGSMTGGATKQTSQSLISRANQLERLEKEIETTTADVQEKERSLQKLSDTYQAAKQKADQLQVEIEEHSRKQSELQIALQYATERLEHTTKQKKATDFELEQSIAEFGKLENEYVETIALKKQQHVAVQLLKEELDTAQLSQEDRYEKVQLLQKELQEISSNRAVGQEQLAQCKRDLNASRQQLHYTEEQIRVLSTKKTEQEQHKESDEEKLEQLNDDYRVATQLLTDTQTKLSELTESKARIEAIIKEKEVARNMALHQLQQLYKEQTKSETKANKYELSIDQKLVYLNEEYDLSFEAASQQTQLEMSIEEAGRLVRSLKQEIERIGSVNVLAIEEYDKVFERSEFLTAQQTDLLEAKKLLDQTIAEMDGEVIRRFNETFEAVRYQFERTFPRLFGGGKATLTLTNPDDLLETGIDIIAQPPGKKLQSLSLLSGGERAFTAIALLFAILEVKPVPFCLLDEVEAALDESNVARYGRYLKEFTNQTQFIVITHRRGTMEQADVLYGVTMQDSGVSKLASVRFEDYEEIQENANK